MCRAWHLCHSVKRGPDTHGLAMNGFDNSTDLNALCCLGLRACRVRYSPENNEQKMFGQVMKALSALLLAFLYCMPTAAWQYSGGDAGGNKYSELSQINTTNVAELKQVWIARSGEHQLLPEAHYKRSGMQSTPILLPEAAGAHLIVCSAANYVIALDPTSGEERWRFDPKVPLVDRPIGYKCRGNVAYWEDEGAEANEACKHRLLAATIDRRLIALDAKNGEPCKSFAEQGELSMRRADDQQRFGQAMSFNSSQPVVLNDTVVIGSSIADLVYKNTPLGTVNAFDVRTGDARWVFNLVPDSSAHPESSTWSHSPRQHSGAVNVWAALSVDEENGLVFVPSSSPSPDFYGAYRRGDNRYGNSLLALRVSDGSLAWHYQFVHHDLWDYDLPAQAILTDYLVDGRKVPAVIQLTKQGMVFIFNRLTGEPLVPIEERPVPADSNVPGEQPSKTQPFSSFPTLVRHSVEPEDIWGLTPIDRWFCKRSYEEIDDQGIYTPPALGKQSMHFPSEGGGSNWGGAALTPQGLMLVNVLDVAQTLELTEQDSLSAANSEMSSKDYMSGQFWPIYGTDYAFRKRPWFSPLGLPCISPPWNKLVAVDVQRQKIVWEVPLGSVHDMLPVPLPFDINGFGVPGIGAGVATAGGLFFMAGTSDRTIRAFDLATGEVLWSMRLPVDAMSGISSIEVDGRQYIVTTAGGHQQLGRETGDYIIAFALPK